MNIEKLQQLILKGKELLNTHKPTKTTEFYGHPTLDSVLFTGWRTQTLSFLRTYLAYNHTYLLNFEGRVEHPSLQSVKNGVIILENLLDDVKSGEIEVKTNHVKFDSLHVLENIFNRFHLVIRQLKDRRSGRSPLLMDDEYDVQYLLHALLTLEFDDIRPEEWTPSYAGKSSRMDFLLKDYKTVIEVKKTRPNLTEKEVLDELIIDIERYSKRQDCEILLCFIYDPGNFVKNPTGVENDLNRDSPIKVKVYIRR